MAITKLGGFFSKSITPAFIGFDALSQANAVKNGTLSAGEAAGEFGVGNTGYYGTEKLLRAKKVTDSVSKFLPKKLQFLGKILPSVGGMFAQGIGATVGGSIGKHLPMWKGTPGIDKVTSNVLDLRPKATITNYVAKQF